VTTDTLQFVHITDPHLFGDPDRRLRGIPTHATLRAVLAEAAPDIARATAILATGDLVQDDPGGYARFRELLAPVSRPVLCIPGNHDDAPALRHALSSAPFQSSGHADFGAWRIILLDSSVAGRAGGRLGGERLEALRRTLAAPGPPHVLVAIHHHPCTMDSAWLDSVGLEDADALFAVLAQDSRVRGIVFGHVHQAFDGQRDGIRLLGTPSTCAQFLPRSDDFAMDTRPPAWRRLALGADGGVSTQLAWLPGARLAALQP
jgi:3',5'-cyclic-AMP phosphodiesterase